MRRTRELRDRASSMRARDGFTLLELMVGLTVGAIALAAGMAALGFVADRAEQVERAGREALEGATSRQLITEWLADARLRSGNSVDAFQGLDIEFDGWPDDILLFPTTARTHLRAGETLVRLYIDRNPDTPERGLVAELVARRGEPGTIIELVPEAMGLNVRFMPHPQGLPQEWQDQWLARNQMPRAVEIVIVPESGAVLPPLLAYPIRVALGTP